MAFADVLEQILDNLDAGADLNINMAIKSH